MLSIFDIACFTVSATSYNGRFYDCFGYARDVAGLEKVSGVDAVDSVVIVFPHRHCQFHLSAPDLVGIKIWLRCQDVVSVPIPWGSLANHAT